MGWVAVGVRSPWRSSSNAEPVVGCVDAEFVVPASQVLNERTATDDDARRSVAFQAAHRSQPGFLSCAVGLDAIVRVHGCVVFDVADHALALSVVTCSGRACSPSTRRKNRGSRSDVTAGRDEDVDHLAVLVHGSVDATRT